MRLAKPKVENISEIRFQSDIYRVVGTEYQLGEVLKIEQESSNTYLVYYENYTERIHNVESSLIKK